MACSPSRPHGPSTELGFNGGAQNFHDVVGWSVYHAQRLFASFGLPLCRLMLIFCYFMRTCSSTISLLVEILLPPCDRIAAEVLGPFLKPPPLLYAARSDQPHLAQFRQVALLFTSCASSYLILACGSEFLKVVRSNSKEDTPGARMVFADKRLECNDVDHPEVVSLFASPIQVRLTIVIVVGAGIC